MGIRSNSSIKVIGGRAVPLEKNSVEASKSPLSPEDIFFQEPFASSSIVDQNINITPQTKSGENFLSVSVDDGIKTALQEIHRSLPLLEKISDAAAVTGRSHEWLRYDGNLSLSNGDAIVWTAMERDQKPLNDGKFKGHQDNDCHLEIIYVARDGTEHGIVARGPEAKPDKQRWNIPGISSQNFQNPLDYQTLTICTRRVDVATENINYVSIPAERLKAYHSRLLRFIELLRTPEISGIAELQAQGIIAPLNHR